MRCIVFISVADPWSYIGVTRLERACAALSLQTGREISLSFRTVDRTWLSQSPGDESMPIESGPTIELAATERAAIERAAQTSSIDMDLSAAVVADPSSAHRLLVWARSLQDGPGDQSKEKKQAPVEDDAGDGSADFGAQQRLLKALWRAAFVEGADISDHIALGSRAALSGLDLSSADDVLAAGRYQEAVEYQYHQAQELDVAHLPVVFINETWRLDGPQSQSVYEQALTRVLDSPSGS